MAMASALWNRLRPEKQPDPTRQKTVQAAITELETMSLFSAQVHPGRALGILVLGASLHDIITRLKSEPQRFGKLDLVYDHAAPLKEPVVLDLPHNGIRLRFDGPQQRLRLIEVLDFTLSKLSYNDREVFRASSNASPSGGVSENQSGPTFRHIYQRLMGPTYPGEYIAPGTGDDTGIGLYVLSYPGVAFSFPVHQSSWSEGKDMVSLLSSPTSPPAASMAIFSGESWPDAREILYTKTLENLKTFAPLAKGREAVADEIGLVKICGGGRLELIRPWNSSPVRIYLGETTPQHLVAELGPPDAIYRKNDSRMSIHKARTSSETRSRPDVNTYRDESTDTDQSSAHTSNDSSDEDEGDGEAVGRISDECFYNYFYHGFDVLVSNATPPSQLPPSRAEIDDAPRIVPTDSTARQVATKIILHGNVPGSYPFNRHRRCRWEIAYLSSPSKSTLINSETPFSDVESSLHAEWKGSDKQRQRGMVLNRDWGDSPGSSCELLGGWEGLGDQRADAGGGTVDEKGLGNTTLFGFPGLVFEVLKNGAVSGLTVF